MVFFWFLKIVYADFLTQLQNQSRDHFRPWLKKLVFFSHRIYCLNFIQIDNVQQWNFQFFKLFRMILTSQNFPKTLNFRVRYFFGDALQHITWTKIKDSEGHG